MKGEERISEGERERKGEEGQGERGRENRRGKVAEWNR
jgi:hypothetical protein